MHRPRPARLVVLAVLFAGCVNVHPGAGEQAEGTEQVGGTEQVDEAGETSETGCQEPSEPVLVSMIDHAAWAPTPADEDPLIAHRPTTVDCGIAGWYTLNDELEIDTNFCNYAALQQPSLVAIDTCTPLRIEFYHFDLLAPEPAQAHAAMLIDGQIVWERFIDIPGGSMPSDAAVYEEDFISPIAAPVGAPVMIHLHNHGQNTWTLLSFEAAPA